MKTKEDALKLAKKMVAIGEQNGRRTAALITNMDYPLGWKIGNALEVQEAVETLRGKGPEDLTQVSLAWRKTCCIWPGKGRWRNAGPWRSGPSSPARRLKRLGDMVEAQGGDPDYIFPPGTVRGRLRESGDSLGSGRVSVPDGHRGNRNGRHAFGAPDGRKRKIPSILRQALSFAERPERT